MRTDLKQLQPIDREHFLKWLATRPESIQRLAGQCPPWFIYRIRSGAPYAVTGPGTEGFIVSYHEHGEVGFVTTFLSTPKDSPYYQHPDYSKLVGGDGKIHRDSRAIKVDIDAKWLERIYEVESTPIASP
jgi:hypothetical protein